MRTYRLRTVDGFIVFDIDDAPLATGVSRLAQKVLPEGVELLARATTYAFARFGIKAGGASGAVNAPPAERDQAAAAYVAEIEPMVASHRFLTDPGLGLTETDLACLRAVDPRPAALWREHRAAALTAAGVVAAVEAMVDDDNNGGRTGGGRTGSLAGKRVVLDGLGPATPLLLDALRSAGAELVAIGVASGTKAPPALSDAPLRPREEAWALPCDALVVTGRTGCIDHEVAAAIDARVLVSASPAPVTAKALAVFQRKGTVVVPDFISIAGPLLVPPFTASAGELDPVAAVRQAATEHRADGVGCWIAAAERAEEFLATWQERLPFGRPLA